MNIPVAILFAVFLLIAVRQIGRIRLGIWQIMLFGALAVLLTGGISPSDALKSINMDVILFLFGMFVIGEALHDSGYLFYASYRLYRRAKNVDYLVLLILFSMGILSAFLMNDTLAIIGTPLVLYFARVYEISHKLLLLTLAFAVTSGSVMSPIGNPQNLLIAINGGIHNPFIIFLKYLFIPTVINLILTFLILKLFYREHFHTRPLNHFRDQVKDHRLALLSKLSAVLVVILVIVKVVVVFLGTDIDFRLTYIALISSLPVLIFSGKRFKIIKQIDWQTLVFFAAMFVLMEAVWQTGFFQSLIRGIDITSIPAIFVISILLSQMISNVPFVALYLPLLMHSGDSTKEMMAIAAGSTIAGNLFILGAASNVIIVQNAEKRGETLTFFEFARVGIPLTAVNAAVYWIFLR